MSFVVAFISVLAGAGAAFLEGWVSMPTSAAERADPGVLFFLGCCVVFYGTTYATGRLMYWILGRSKELQSVAQTGGWHMLVLHSVMLIGIAAGCVYENRIREFVPAIFVSIVALIISIRDVRAAHHR